MTVGAFLGGALMVSGGWAGASLMPVPGGEAVEVVLQELEIRSRPDDLVVKLQTEPAHRFDAERVWSVSSRAEGFGCRTR